MSPPVQSSNEILVVQMERVIQDVAALRADLKEYTGTLQKLPLVEQQVRSLDGKMDRGFKAIADIETSNKINNEAITGAKIGFRIMAGVASSACVLLTAFSGWAWGQLEASKKYDSALAERIKVLEIRYETDEKINDKMTSGGWVRGK